MASSAPSASLSGHTFLAGRRLEASGPPAHGFNPLTNQELEPAFPDSSLAHVDQACRAAEACFDDLRARPREQRARLLDAIADEILGLGDTLLERATQETALPLARLEGERARTVGQLRMFAEIVRSGSFLGVEHDTPLPERKPLPRPDLRLIQIPLGPVAVFGASNFPLAFSVAGGDSASALAAGCPIVVKAHPAHPGTSELVAGAVQQAVARTGMPPGIFSMLHGHRHEIGQALATHPAIRAIAFTGSRQGGEALLKTAAARPVPVPVYAEMGSVNPVFLLPAAAEARGPAIAQAFVDSLTLGSGQFCTQPGLVFALRGAATDAWLAAAAAALSGRQATAMLNPAISRAYQQGLDRWSEHPHVAILAQGAAATDDAIRGRGTLFTTSVEDFLQSPELGQEIFGPSSLVILCDRAEQLVEAAQALEGQLTATLQLEPADLPTARLLVPVLERKAGRLLANGFPTGVEVGTAMSHGGPYPASSDGRSTSVGAHAIDRFLRPVCFQSFPTELLPADLQDLPATS